MSQQQLAQELQERHGVTWHQTTVGKVEAGSRPVRLAEALAVADVLDVHVNQLLDQPAGTDEAEQRYTAALYHARVSEIENLERDLSRRKRQLRHWLAPSDRGRDVVADGTAAVHHPEPRSPADDEIREASDGQHREAP